MQAKFYITDSSTNTVNKTLTNESVFNIKLKAQTDMRNPLIMLQGDLSIFKYNYCYIPTFDRYYYVVNITSVNNSVFRVELKADVLMSFKDDILSSVATVTKCTRFNEFGSDVQLKNEVRKAITVYDNDFEFSGNIQIALVVIGG